MGNLINATGLATTVSFLILGVPLLGLLVGPLLLRWVWNLTLPELFSCPKLRYWQAFRVLVLAVLLFGVPRLL